MKYCKHCLQPDTRPNTQFSDNGICPACIYSQTLQEVDWKERQSELKEVVAFGKANSSSGYDCIIGVSGGKDSTRQAIFVKEQLGMNPLLVSLNYPPNQVTQRGVDNISNLIKNGFDCINIMPAPETWRKLMLKGFLEYGNWGKSTEYALYSSVPRLAINFGIPLIWWGENPALQLGDMATLGSNGYDGNKLKNMNTVGGGDISWLIDKDISANQLLQYTYPTESEMTSANLRIIYLGYFWKNWSLLDNGIFSALRGLEIRNESPLEIGDPVGVTALDEDWVTLNQMIKYLKYGFGRVTDYVNEDIRIGRIGREEGISLVEKFDGACGKKYILSFCDYLGISETTFWKTIDQFVNLKLFNRLNLGKYTPKFIVGKGL